MSNDLTVCPDSQAIDDLGIQAVFLYHFLADSSRLSLCVFRPTSQFVIGICEHRTGKGSEFVLIYDVRVVLGWFIDHVCNPLILVITRFRVMSDTHTLKI